jgi:hypothetical protein
MGRDLTIASMIIASTVSGVGESGASSASGVPAKGGLPNSLTTFWTRRAVSSA